MKPNSSTPVVIAVDGHSSTGKSTFAKIIAKKLGYIYVDSGAMYRAFTLFALRRGIVSEDGTINRQKLCSFLDSADAMKESDISFRPTGADGASETYLNGEKVEKEIRTMRISSIVSHLAALPPVRQFIDRLIHRIDGVDGMVMDGRDIGTAVFPDAELKLFMTADVTVRAQRRYDELKAKGDTPDFDAVLRNVKERDYLDEHRDTAPLVRAKDAVLLDNSRMTIAQQTDWIMDILKERSLI